MNREDGTRIVVLDSRAAFHTAQRLHPDLVLPEQKQSTTWNSLYADDLHERSISRPAGDGHPRIRFGAAIVDRVSGIPTPLSTIIDGPDDDGTADYGASSSSRMPVVLGID